MNWENIIPTAAAPSEVRVAEPAMDSDQFAAFYERSSRPLWAYLARTSGDPALADDLMQESFVRFSRPMRRKTARSPHAAISSASARTCCTITGVATVRCRLMTCRQIFPSPTTRQASPTHG